MNNRIQEIMDLEHFKTLTPIQEQVLNRKNKNRDIIGVSSTGSGKSHAFFMPIFEMLDFDQDCVQAVISAPTRELAYQLYDRCRKIAKHFHVRVKLVTGGMEILDVLPCIQPYVCLIFANTTLEAQSIANTMRENGYDLVELHSGLESRARMQAIKMIQSQKKSYIVASDIASRGIDLEGITHVISCGFPKDLKFYIHRAGRTGRASRDGQCIALYKESDAKSIQSLIKQGIAFEHQDVKNKQFVDLKPYVNKRPMKKDEFHEEVEKIVHKKKKVKPNYKKRQRQEIDRMKRRKRREMIKSDIKRQQKERAKERQRQKGMDV